MKVARFGRVRPVTDASAIFGSTNAGPDGQSLQSIGSNTVSWGSNVAIITSNGSNALIGPYVNFASGTGIAFAASSNTLTISSTGGGGGAGTPSFGSNSTRVSEVSSAGASSDSARGDHIHDGIGTITSSSSNTMQRGTWNIRPGAGIALSLTDTDGDGEFDTTTIVNTGQGAGSSPPSSGTSDPIEDAFGTPDTAFEFETSSLTGLTSFGTPDVDDADTTVAGHYLLADDDSTQCGRYAAVSTPCTMIVKLTDFVAYENFQYVGAFVGEGTPGKIEGIHLLGGASPSLVMRQWNPFSSGSPTSISITRVPTDSVGFTPWWFGIRVASSTDISYYVSRSGVIWQPLLLNRDPSFTVGSAGVAVGNYAGGSQPRAAGCYDYIRIWNSAKTFPAFS